MAGVLFAALALLDGESPSRRSVPGERGGGLLVAMLPKFSASPRVKTFTAAFNARCAPELAAHKEHVQRYRQLERVLVFEPPQWASQGIGTLVWWYVGAWELGMKSARAAFFSNGPSGDGFELNRLFHADALSRKELINWNWADPLVRRNVSETMARHGLRAPDGIVHSVCEERKNCVFHARARRVPRRQRRGARASARGDARRALHEDDAASTPHTTLHSALGELDGCRWVAVRIAADAHQRPVLKWPTSWVARVMHRISNDGLDCLTASVLRPAPAVQRALLPVLRGLPQPAGTLAGLHVRTLGLDIILRGNGRTACGREEYGRQAALLGLMQLTDANGSAVAESVGPAPIVHSSLDGAWAMWSRMASGNCPHCGEPTQAEQLPVCRGLVDVGSAVPALRGRGMLGALLACPLVRSAGGTRARAGVARIFLATDSVGLLKLLHATPGVSRLIVTSENAPVHVQCDRSKRRVHDSCGGERRRDAAGVKAAADLVMLGMSDWAMQYSASTFFDTALAMNPLFRPGASVGAGECVRAPWSVPGCRLPKSPPIHWTSRCDSGSGSGSGKWS
ncbi:hypothetical protein KFE25_002489 [Diacronema lutheri]|uniref:Uncharacterized protein n=1 Tax=Diacronema lutheri TaxID=2081491 RepID=A0A8J6C1R7_DIALT|nr:hypothetical protein KFE25_002489 [Diacronema lutheri]